MVLAITNRFLHWLVIGLLSPVMVLVILSKGIALESVGFIMATLSIFVVLFELPSGILSDRIGRKTVYLISIVILASSFAVFLLGEGSLAIGAGCCLFGIARAFSSGSIESDFIDRYIDKHGKDSMHRIITGMSVGQILGLAAGALAGGFLPGIWARFFPGRGRYDGNLIAPLVVLGALFAITAFCHASRARPKHESLSVFLRESAGFVKSDSMIRYLLFGTMLWGLCFSALETYWQPRLKAMLVDGSGLSIFGIINSGYFVAALAGTALSGFLLSKRKASALPIIGALRIMLGLAMVILSLQNGVAGFSLWFLVVMGCNGMASVPEETALNARIPESKRASILSLSSLTVQTGGIVSSICFGLLSARVSIGIIWSIAGTIFCVSALLYLFLDSRSRGREGLWRKQARSAKS